MPLYSILYTIAMIILLIFLSKILLTIFPWFLIHFEIKLITFTMTHKSLHNVAPCYRSDFVSTIFPFMSIVIFSYSLKMPETLLPQGLCMWHILCLECTPPDIHMASSFSLVLYSELLCLWYSSSTITSTILSWAIIMFCLDYWYICLYLYPQAIHSLHLSQSDIFIFVTILI